MSNDDKLKFLGQTATDLPENAGRMIDQVAAAFESLKEAFNEETFLPGDFEQAFAFSEQQIRQFIDETKQEYSSLQEQAQRTSAILDSLSEAISEGSGRLGLDVDGLIGEISEFDRLLAAELKRVEGALEGFKRIQSEREQSVETRMPTVVSEFESLNEKYDDVGQAIETFDSKIEKQLDAMDDVIYEEKGDLETDIENWVLLVDGMLDYITEKVKEKHDQTDEAVNELTNEAWRQMQSNVIETTEQVCKEMDEGIDLVKKLVDESSSQTSDVRDKARPALERMQSSVEQVEKKFDSIQEMAQRFSGV